MPRWLVARTDGSDARIVDAASPQNAVTARVRDEDDPIRQGDVVYAHRLGNFPEQFEAGVRSLGRPSLRV